MLSRLILFGLVLAGLPAAATTPIAEVVCAPRDEIVARLTVQYRSAVSGTGLRDADAMIEVWADPEGRWTLVQSYADGQACILAMGSDWASVARDPA